MPDTISSLPNDSDYEIIKNSRCEINKWNNEVIGSDKSLQYFKDVSIELNDDMVKLIERFHDDTHIFQKARMSNVDYLLNILRMIFGEIHRSPDKFSYKDFDTINEMVKQSNIDQSQSLDENKSYHLIMNFNNM